MQQVLILMLVLWASPSWAFPDNGVLETFTGADTTSPPNANWTNAQLANCGAVGVDIEDNAATTSTTSSRGCAYWDTTSFNADQEVYATVVNIGVTSFGQVCGRLVNIGASTTDGYCAEWADGASTIIIYRVDNEVRTQIGTTITQSIDVNDRWGLKMVGNQICAWFSDNGAAWTELQCATDGTYSAGGYIGLTVTGDTTVGAIDDFGGGDVTAAASRRPGSPIIFQ